VYDQKVSDETGSQALPTPIPEGSEERTVGDAVAGAVETVLRPFARMLGRRGPCADCARRKAKIKATVDGVGKIRIGRRPR